MELVVYDKRFRRRTDRSIKMLRKPTGSDFSEALAAVMFLAAVLIIWGEIAAVVVKWVVGAWLA